MLHFIMMCGLPGSGKSTLAEELSVEYNTKIHSSDSIRMELFGDAHHQDDNGKVFNELKKRVKDDLSNGISVIFDACNINYKRRMAFIQEIRKYGAHKICYIVSKVYEQCLEDNSMRERPIPDDVITNMFMNFYVPQKYEGWDEIKLEACGESGELSKLINRAQNYQQDNEHHSRTLLEHMDKTYVNVHCGLHIARREIANRKVDYNLLLAALYHDLGKLYTKTFINKKGIEDKNAHYYNHHNVGAYLFLTHSDPKYYGDEKLSDMLEVCAFIQWHMRPFDIENNGGKEKFIRLVGEDFYNRLMILHEADVLAH